MLAEGLGSAGSDGRPIELFCVKSKIMVLQLGNRFEKMKKIIK